MIIAATTRSSSRVVNKTPTLHWGQATMLCALAGLYQALVAAEHPSDTATLSMP